MTCRRLILLYLGNPVVWHERATPWSSGSVLDHRSLPSVFESRRGHFW